MDCCFVRESKISRIEAELCVESPTTELGEGSIWDSRSRRLLWLDIMGAKLYRYDPATDQNEEHDLSTHSPAVSSVVPLAATDDPSGDRVGVTLRDGFAIYDFRTKDLEVLPGNPSVSDGERFNDGKADPAGRYWAGTLARDGKNNDVPQGSLYRRNTSGSVDRVLDGVTTSNGLAWAKDGKTMYYIDSPTGRVDIFDFDAESGDISNRRPCIRGFGQHTGWPDGCAIDAEGCLWVARFNGGCAGRYDPVTGKLLAEVMVPKAAGRQVTSVAFGGDGLGDLFLTTAREGRTLEEAAKEGLYMAGSLFRVRRAALEEIGVARGAQPGTLAMSS